MASISLYEALAGSAPDENYYLGQDPWYGAARNLSQAQLPAARTNMEAILYPALQGLAVGTMAGYGREHATNKAYLDYASNPLLKALSGSTALAGQDPATAALHDYTQEAAPEGWTPRVGKSDMLMAALQGSIGQENSIRQLDALNDLQKSLAGKGLILSGEGKIVPIPGIAEVQADQAEKEARGKEIGRIKGLRDAYGEGGAGGDSNLPLDPEQRAKAILDMEDRTYKRVVDLPSYKSLSDIEPNFKTLLKVKDNESAAAAPTMITTFARILDPGVSVREGDYKTVSSNVQGILDQFGGNWRKAMEGKTSLSKEARDAMVKIAAEKYNQFGNQYEEQKIKLLNSLDKQGGNRANIPVLGFEPFQLADGVGDSLSNNLSEVPPGMRLLRNRQTGETKLVPQ